MNQPVRVSLPDFLARLDDATAAEARAAAARIDALARTGQAMEGIERRFLPWAAAAGLAFAAGVVLFFLPDMVPPAVVVVCIAALPAVAVAYALRTMARTRADRAAEELNVRHFLPHGGLYFPQGQGPACVVLVPAQDVAPGGLRGPGVRRRDIWW